MYTDPNVALQFSKEHQAQLRHQAQTDRLAAEYARQRRKPFMLRISNLLVYSGLWLRAHVEREPGAEALPAGRWRAMPLVMLQLAGGQTTAASLQWWPVYSMGLGSIARSSGYAIIPTAWLPCSDVKRLP
jgi:hypothetical protein